MKKMYIFLVFATHVFPTHAMELQKNSSITQLLFSENPFAECTETPVNDFKHYQHLTPMIHTTYPINWEAINGIAYNEGSKIAPHAPELVPVYHPIPRVRTKKLIEGDENKPFLYMFNPVEPQQKLIDKLYLDACNIIKNPYLDALITVIDTMNRAKNNNLDEDIMGKYSYKKWEDDHASLHTKATLFFGYLKHYNLTINTTKENFLTINDVFRHQSSPTTTNQLAKILGLSSFIHTPARYREYDKHTVQSKYPAFHTLGYNIRNILITTHIENFLSYIYLKPEQNILKNDYLPSSYDELKQAFYDKTYTAFLVDKSYLSLKEIKKYTWAALKIIEAGKKLTPEKQEDDFAHDILQSEQTTLRKVLATMKIDTTLNVRKRMCIMCHLIKKYNAERKAKITPSLHQLESYKNCPFNFAFPAQFDRTLFNKEIYAFEKFEELIHDIQVAKYSSNEEIQECIDQLYSSRK